MTSEYVNWLVRHGTQGEVRAFDMLSQTLLKGAIGIASATSVSDGNPSFVMRTYISLDFIPLIHALDSFIAEVFDILASLLSTDACLTDCTLGHPPSLPDLFITILVYMSTFTKDDHMHVY